MNLSFEINQGKVAADISIDTPDQLIDTPEQGQCGPSAGSGAK
jgi:hypothetical protein